MMFYPCMFVGDDVGMAKFLQCIDLIEHGHKPAMIVSSNYAMANTDGDLFHCIDPKLHIIQHMLTGGKKNAQVTK